jgi:hypothetical protein
MGAAPGFLEDCGETGAGLAAFVVGGGRTGVSAGFDVRLRRRTTGRALGVLFFGGMRLSWFCREFSFGAHSAMLLYQSFGGGGVR